MRDRLLAAIVIIGALLYLYADSRLPRLAIGDPLGPRVFPALIGLGLLGSGLLLVVETLGRPRAEPPRHRRWRHEHSVLLATAVWTAAYYAAFEPVGYPIATPVYLLALLAYFNRNRPATNVAVAVGFTAVAYVVFDRFLGVAMPLGLIAS